jgi:site-specific DNA recombinase
MTKRAVIYARVSRDDRDTDGRNLAGQLAMGRKYCEANGYSVVDEKPEDERGASGAEIDLPQLLQIREKAQAREFDVLIVREIDRLSRNLA